MKSPLTSFTHPRKPEPAKALLMPPLRRRIEDNSVLSISSFLKCAIQIGQILAGSDLMVALVHGLASGLTSFLDSPQPAKRLMSDWPPLPENPAIR